MPATLTNPTAPTAQATDHVRTRSDQTPAVTLCQIMQQTAPYAVEVDGNQLAPRYRHGQEVTLYPALCADVAQIAPGTLVLAAVEHPHRPNQYHHFGLFILGTGGELQSGVCTIIEPGRFLVLGTETEPRPSVFGPAAQAAK